MPQMAPMNWLLMFLIFFSTFIMFNVMNYYSFKPSTPKLMIFNNPVNTNSLNWKW